MEKGTGIAVTSVRREEIAITEQQTRDKQIYTNRY
jgi:hypothetical protein